MAWGPAAAGVMFWFGWWLWTRAAELPRDEAAVFGVSARFEALTRWGHRFGGLLFVVAAVGNPVKVVAYVV